MKQLEEFALANYGRAMTKQWSSFERAARQVKNLVKILTQHFHKLLTCKHQEMEARVGIDRVSPSTSHSKSIVYGIADYLTINELCRLSTLIRTYLFVSVFAWLNSSVLAFLLALFPLPDSGCGQQPSQIVVDYHPNYG